MIKSVIFDLGGVYFTNGTRIAIEKISNKHNLNIESVEQSLEVDTELGTPYRKGEITTKEYWNKVKKFLGVEANNSDLNSMWVESYELIKGTVNTIKRLKDRGIKLYFLSDNVKERVEYTQKKFDFLKDFIDGIFSYEVHSTKGEGENIFRLALDKTGEKPENVVYVDDKEKYTETAKRIGMNAICFKNPEQLDEELKKLGL
jgi:putative hydrolase of the HAD superfamily